MNTVQLVNESQSESLNGYRRTSIDKRKSLLSIDAPTAPVIRLKRQYQDKKIVQNRCTVGKKSLPSDNHNKIDACLGKMFVFPSSIH